MFLDLEGWPQCFKDSTSTIFKFSVLLKSLLDFWITHLICLMFSPLSFSARCCSGSWAVWQRLGRNVEVKQDVQQWTSSVPHWKWRRWKQRTGRQRHEEHLRALRRGGGGGGWRSGTEFGMTFFMDKHHCRFGVNLLSFSLSQSVRLWWGSARWWRNPNLNQWQRFWRGSVSLSTSPWSFFQRRLYLVNRWRSGHCVTASFPSIPKVNLIFHTVLVSSVAILSQAAFTLVRFHFKTVSFCIIQSEKQYA